MTSGNPSHDSTALQPHHTVPLDALKERFGDIVVRDEVVHARQQVVYVEPGSNLEVLAWLKEDPGQHFDFLADVTAVDFGGGRPLEVVYQLFSLPHRHALRVKCVLPLESLEIRSVTGLWMAADWLEREVYDLFGIHFEGHPDLRRILMPQNYAEGHPLRKDFPLRGRFSREEQTERALALTPEDFYKPDDFSSAGEPQLVPPANTSPVQEG